MPIVTAAIATAAGAPLLFGAAAGNWTTYTVRDGDTLWDIAGTYRTDVRTLLRANQLSDAGQRIQIGARLRVPGVAKPAPRKVKPAATGRYVVRYGDTISAIALRLKVSPSTLLTLNRLDARGLIYAGQFLRVPAAAARAQAKQAAATRAAARYTTYTVRPGDTVSAIALRVRATQAAVLKANQLRVNATIQPGQKLRVPAAASNSFAGRTYPDSVVRAASTNRSRLASRAIPGREATKTIIARTAEQYGVDPGLALALAYQESGWNQRQVSVANAIGVMQVVPASGRWASDLTGRRLNLLDTYDNITAGVVILKALSTAASSREQALAGYYQGLASVRSRGMYADTVVYVRNVMRLTGQFS